MQPPLALSRSAFTSRFGEFELHSFTFPAGDEHAALVSGDDDGAPPLVRIQSSCLTGTAFGATLCDCRQQLERALAMVARARSGCVVYLAQEGRSHGLTEKVAQLAEIRAGADTVDAARRRGRDIDLRDYGPAARILEAIYGRGRAVRLMTNSPEKLAGVRAAGIAVEERVGIETPPTPGNRAYLEVKKRRMGHWIDVV